MVAELIKSADEEGAIYWHKKGEMGRAVPLYQKVIVAEEKNSSARYLLASIYIKQNKLLQANHLLRQAIEISPHNPSYYLLSGSNLFQQDQLEAAQEMFEKGWRLLYGLPESAFAVPLLIFAKLLTAPVEYIKDLYNYYADYGALLERKGYFLTNPQIITQAQKLIVRIKTNSPHFIARLYGLFSLLAFDKYASPTKNQFVVESIFLPLLHRALAQDSISIALQLEIEIYERFIKQTESEAHFARWFPLLAAPLQLKGQQLNLALELKDSCQENSRKVAFFFHVENMLAHSKVILELLTGRAQLHGSDFEPVLFVFSKNNGKRLQAFMDLGVEVVFLDDYVSASDCELEYKKILKLREFLLQRAISVCVWVSVPTLMAFAFSLRVAPIQIWWSMKYHSYCHADVDGYFTNGSLQTKRKINNRDWQVVHSAITFTMELEKAKLAREFRQQFSPKAFILGALGREEKLCDGAYLKCVCSILKQRPNTVFLWTGRNRLPVIENYFVAQGVADRCFFIGWVDTDVVTQVLDLYLDTFPLGGGHTVFQSMFYGKAMIMRESSENLETGVIMHMLTSEGRLGDDPKLPQNISDHFTNCAGECLIYLANNDDEYVNHALKLIDCKKSRIESGNLNRLFVDTFMADKQQMALSFGRQLQQLKEEMYALKNLPF